jgi:hypothetical protein
MKRRVLKRIPLHFVFLWLTALALHPVQAEAIPPLPSNMLPLMFVENIGQVDGVERDENSANNTVEKDVIVYTFDTFVPVLLSPPDNGSVSDTTPTFRWQPIPGAVGYEIQYSRGDVATSETIATSTNSFTPRDTLADNKLQLAGTGYWRRQHVYRMEQYCFRDNCLLQQCRTSTGLIGYQHPYPDMGASHMGSRL